MRIIIYLKANIKSLPEKIMAVLLLMSTSFGVSQDLCRVWSEATRLGDLASAINESSGISSSLLFPERLYHTNDSWNDGPEFFVSDLEGKQLQTITLNVDKGLIPTIDIEDMDVGPCPEGSCIFLADIGDNLAKRSEIHILITPEAELFSEAVSPKVLTLRYPDGSHDAEAFAIHPNGDLYILTKEVFPIKTPPANLYRLKKHIWGNNADSYTLELVASIDVRALSGSSVEVLSHIVTSMDISADGKRLLLLTYGEVFELQKDLATLSTLTTLFDIPFKKIEVVTLLQQESISYTAKGYGFIYSAEARGQASPLLEVICQE